MTTPSPQPALWSNEAKLPGLAAELREAWTYRRFVGYLGGRALQKLYLRTVLGWSWVLIRPLFPIALRVLIFGGLIGMTADGLPYFLFLMTGSLGWNLFASALSWSTRGLEMNTDVLSCVYVPKIIFPIAIMFPALLNFAITAGAFFIVAGYYWIASGTLYVSLGWHSVWVVLALLGILVLALGIGFFAAVSGETAKDARFAMGQILSIWYLVTPVLYATSQVSPQYRGWLLLNPMAAFVEAFKYGVLGLGAPSVGGYVVALTASVAIAAGGLVFFARHIESDDDE